MSTIYVCKGGKLIPRDPEKSTQNKPKVIAYTHMIRHLPEVQCNCEQEKQRLINEYESQLAQKDNEITILVQRIAQKETQIDKLEEQLLYFKNLQNTPSIKEEQSNNNTNDDINWGEMNKSLNSTVVSCFSLCEWNQTAQKIKNQETKTEKEMDDCFKKTNTLMTEIDNIMKKKRKYEFHNPILVENSIIEELQMSQQKSQQDTQEIQMQDTFFIQQYSQYNDDFDSLDMTTFESVQNFGDGSENDGSFYSKLLRDSIVLKNTIIQMRQESQEQMNQLEAYYQKQLKISYEELQKERQKNGLVQITKDKLAEMSQKGRQALAEIDQNQNDDGQSFYSNQQNSNLNSNKPIYSIHRLSPQREDIQNSLGV